jgi:hypothetical protein
VWDEHVKATTGTSPGSSVETPVEDQSKPKRRRVVPVSRKAEAAIAEKHTAAGALAAAADAVKQKLLAIQEEHRLLEEAAEAARLASAAAEAKQEAAINAALEANSDEIISGIYSSESEDAESSEDDD